ncbi:hypothetical protein ZWY2020_031918 [Hordeum vulgare]|nr:hypothetical protein ZWY2020_031918 [Hordeum vulgare]
MLLLLGSCMLLLLDQATHQEGSLRNLKVLFLPFFSFCNCKQSKLVSLATLYIQVQHAAWDMPNWEVWSSFEEEVAAGAWGEDGAAEIGKEDAQSARFPLLASLVLLRLEGCPKLRALPRQLGKEATSLKELRLVGTNSLKAVEDLPLLSELLNIRQCEDVSGDGTR